MANATQTIKNATTIISGVAAKMLEDQMPFIKSISKEPLDSFGQVNGYNPGDTININKPARFLATSNTTDVTSTIQDFKEERVPLTLNSNPTNVSINFTSREIATDLALKSWMKRMISPAMSSIAQSIETSLLTTVKNATFNQVGTAGTTTFDTDTMLSAREKLMKNLVPDDNIFALLDSTAMRSAVNARKGLFNKTEEVAKQYTKGYMGNADGFEYLESNLLPLHTRGTQTGSFTVTTTVSVEGQATIALTGTSGGTLKAGDVFTIAGVSAVHPITKVTQNYLQQFVVTADNTASGTAYTGVAISPALYTSASNGLQTVSAFPTSTSAVTIVGTASTGYTQNIAFHPSAVRFISVPLVNPAGADECSTATTKNGITVRVWQDSLILTDKRILRIDVLWGAVVVRPEWICRLTA
jgi:hypothetical protein